ncbi:MAG: tRNA pseudouridine(38-40) synthase TruA [Bacteroidetes bacterium]|jgi:tRNA pseudouridine38-40 synthase|nr:tRNA pseudouridine(38-40) synthase TruA [Bacteroidota bacterium]
MRYFAELAYNGAAYHGWQSQPRQVSVQSTIEQALSTLLNRPTGVVGCGRTDAGVHALQYFLHFDCEGELPPAFRQRINKFLPKDIAIYRFIPVSDSAHARFDASHRAYEYRIDFRKNPFGVGTRYYYPYPTLPDRPLMQQAADLLMGYEAFYPFCKSNTDVKTMRCDLRQAKWEGQPEDGHMRFHVAADRFLRGMIRLMVGACLNIGTGKLPLAALREAMDKQQRLTRSWSAPPDGLYLKDIRYPFISQ